MSNRIGLMMKLALSAATLAGAAALSAVSTQALEVTVNGLRNSQGSVVVCVWRERDSGFPNCGTGKPWKKLSAPASQPAVMFADLPAGTYAVSMFHDEKQTGKPETNFMGMPTSGVGIANNPSIGPMNRPTFEKATVVIPDAKAISITVKYLF